MKKKVFVVTLVVLVSFLLLADTSKAFENSVAGIFLDDAKSMKRIFPDGKMKLIEKNGYHVNIENKKQTEVFSAFFCEGDATLCFSIFVVKEKLNNFRANCKTIFVKKYRMSTSEKLSHKVRIFC